jgi:D-cysteine desulfhydrase/L-cysteate sulfo-lyase
MKNPLAAFARHRLAHLPTPLAEMKRLRGALGPQCPRLFIKRDDCTGLAFGGNKTRKLEFLVGAALAEGADTLVTTGAVQSNHARQTAAAAAAAGLACKLVLFDIVPYDGAAYRRSGNLLLDGIFGAEIEIVPAGTPQRETFERVFAELEGQGRKPYFVPTGGSNAIGALGYAAAYGELHEQLREQGIGATRLVHASSSGGTQAGLIVGRSLAGAGPRVEGINVYRPDHDAMAAGIAMLAADTAAKLGLDRQLDDVILHGGVLGAAYGLPTPEMRDAVYLLARIEGILLDPVYTGKAMVGLLHLIRTQAIAPDETIVFLHTGGAPGIFAYEGEFGG